MAVPGKQVPEERHPARPSHAEAELRTLLAQAMREESRASFQARREAVELQREEAALEQDLVEVDRRRLSAHREGLGFARDLGLTAVCLVAVGVVLAAFLVKPDPYLALALLGVLGGGVGIGVLRKRSGLGGEG